MTSSRPPCALPALPQPFKFIGYPADHDDKIYVTKSDLVELVGYLQASRLWIEVATTCLEVK